MIFCIFDFVLYTHQSAALSRIRTRRSVWFIIYLVVEKMLAGCEASRVHSRRAAVSVALLRRRDRSSKTVRTMRTTGADVRYGVHAGPNAYQNNTRYFDNVAFFSLIVINMDCFEFWYIFLNLLHQSMRCCYSVVFFLLFRSLIRHILLIVTRFTYTLTTRFAWRPQHLERNPKYGHCSERFEFGVRPGFHDYERWQSH